MGNIAKRGVEMYQKTMNQKPAPETPGKPDGRKLQDGLLKTIKTAGVPPLISRKSDQVLVRSAPVSGEAESKIRRVAKFLILIGSDQAAEILSNLDPEQVEKISAEIARINVIKPEEAEEILAEFRSLFSGPYRFTGASHGGVETARRILYAAKGPEKGEELLNKAVPDSKENILSFLEEYSPDQLGMILKTESPQAAALVLSRLSPKLSAGTLIKLPPEYKPEILRRIAHQKEIAPETLEQVAQALKEKVRNVSGGAKDLELDGVQALAAILKQGDYSFGDRIINELEQNSPDIGKDLKERLYTLDDVVNAIDRPIQEKLSSMADRDIAILIKGRGAEFQGKIMSCVSSVRRQLIRDESEILGAVPKRDCDAAVGEFLAWFRQARENGEIFLYTDEDVFV
ncbi:MAG: flagellar motor switch protein FliG [Treponema sp.]|jgi:flagellar motor switch protein FliG|nr:flagellar motor switch protein FliG [Treponema sp.]